MQDEQESKYTTLGIAAGVGCTVLLMFYAISTGAMPGGSRAGTCSSCRLAGEQSPRFETTRAFSNTNKFGTEK